MAHMLKKLIFLTHPGGHDGQRPYESHQRLCGVHVQNAEVQVHLPRGCPFFLFLFKRTGGPSANQNEQVGVRQSIKTVRVFVSPASQ